MALFSTSVNVTNQVMKSRRLPVSSQTSKLVSGLFLALLAWFLVAPTQVTSAQTENVIYSFCSVPNCADGFLDCASCELRVPEYREKTKS